MQTDDVKQISSTGSHKRFNHVICCMMLTHSKLLMTCLQIVKSLESCIRPLSFLVWCQCLREDSTCAFTQHSIHAEAHGCLWLCFHGRCNEVHKVKAPCRGKKKRNMTDLLGTGLNSAPAVYWASQNMPVLLISFAFARAIIIQAALIDRTHS